MRDDPAVAAWIERAKGANILEIARELQPRMRRAGSDWNGPCLGGCGKADGDGFVVTPGKGVFLCRPSGSGGGIIDMVMHARTCAFLDAVEFITHEAKPGAARAAEAPGVREKRETEAEERRAAGAARAEEDAKAAETEREREQREVAELQKRAVPIAGTAAEAYLAARRLGGMAATLLRDLSFIPALEYWGYATAQAPRKTLLATLPVMLAKIRDVDGKVIGMHRTYLHATKPEKWAPPVPLRNKAKKIVGDAKGGMIRLGRIEPIMAIGEGIETTLSWHRLGFGPPDVGLAAAVSLGNLSGRCTGTLSYRDKTGKFPNGVPDLDDPGVILPEGVTEIYLLGDGDSEQLATKGRLLAAGRRWRAQGRKMFVHMAPLAADFSDVLMAQEIAA